jgi:hypothetical protein
MAMMPEPSPHLFVWSFPVYVLANNYTLTAHDKIEVTIDTGWAGKRTDDGECHLAIFTDSDNAETYRQAFPLLNFRAFGMMPQQFVPLLKTVGRCFPWIAIDPHPDGREALTVLTADVVTEFENYLATQA